MEEMKCYKSLDAHNQFTNGWVSRVSSFPVTGTDKVIVLGKVRHSQSITSKKPLTPWIIAEKTGNILAAHCDCMAGLGEACTHIGAVLFYVNAASTLERNKTVTEEAAYWLLPASINRVPYEPIANIDFTSASKKKRKIEEKLNTTPVNEQIKMPLPPVQPPTQQELENFFSKLHISGNKAAVLSVLPNYSKEFVPEASNVQYPWLSYEFRHDLCNDVSKDILHEICTQIFKSGVLNVSKKSCYLVEQLTRGQSSNKVWHRFRSGRITASNMKKVCQTSSTSPAVSTVKAICHPSLVNTKATQWGCMHEKHALDAYRLHMQPKHEGLVIRECGLYIHPEISYIGATPDAIVQCKCCGTGVLEIKCPYSSRDKSVADCFTKLDSTHSHYFQIQTQIFVCNVDFGDYFAPDEEIWSTIVNKSKEFFRLAILPELVGGVFSNPRPTQEELDMCPVPQQIAVSTDNSPNATIIVPSDELLFENEIEIDDDDVKELFCKCRSVYDDNLDYIGCDNDSCKYQWWHFKCASITAVPKGKWLCPECQSKKKFKKISVTC